MTGYEPPYIFDDQLSHGEHGETFLDRFFSRWFRIEPATPEEQRRGIDRIFYNSRHRRTLTIEYKTDTAAARTGNAFIETISVDAIEKAGWVFTTEADILIYYIPGKSVLYVLRMAAVRSRLPFWLLTYKVREIPNLGYYTHGLLVPLDELERCADRVLLCDEEFPHSADAE